MNSKTTKSCTKKKKSLFAQNEIQKEYKTVKRNYSRLFVWFLTSAQGSFR